MPLWFTENLLFLHFDRRDLEKLVRPVVNLSVGAAMSDAPVIQIW